jgi:deoxyribodipyrimidine photo-lyase
MSISDAPENGSRKEFLGTRSHALTQLREFIPNVSSYSALRNYARLENTGVSQLSPYIRHRLISEEEVITAVTSQVSFDIAEKFLQEVVWRTYWKGALHRDPRVWSSYEERLKYLSHVKCSEPWGNLYEAARAGTTDLPYFNEWVKELVATGYLHNHVRMWFASIWVFTFKIPWHLGAAFMYHHLLDGDPASNTLSWRWVAGLHTKGKTYLARADNIKKYSDGRWNPNQSELAATPFHIEDEVPGRPSEPLVLSQLQHSASDGLIVTTDDLSIETVLHMKPYKSVCIYAPQAAEQSVLKGAFLQQAIQDFHGRLAAVRSDIPISVATSLTDIANWHEANDLSIVEIIAPHIGPLSEPLRNLIASLSQTRVSVALLQRSWDTKLYPLCDKGFFTLWERFKKRWGQRDELRGVVPITNAPF